MLLKRHSVLKSTFIYAFTEGINKGLNFLLLPWLSYYLVPSELGIVTNYTILFAILNLLSSTIFVSSITYFYYECKKKEIKSLVSLIVLTSFLIIAVFFILALMFRDFVLEKFGINFHLQLLLLLHLFAISLVSIVGLIYRLRNKPYSFAVFQIIQITINISLLILLVIVYKLGATGRIIGMATSSIIMGAVSLVIMVKNRLFGAIDKITVNRLFKFSIPLFPHGISYWFKNGTDKIIITMFCGLSANGLYSMALSISAIFNTVVTSFNNAFTPDLQKRLSDLDHKSYEDTISVRNKIVKQVYIYALGFILLFLFSYVFIEFCFHFVINKQYFKSKTFLPWLLLGLLFDSFYSLTIQYIYKAKKTVGLGIITFICSSTQMLVSYLIVPKFGPIGAAYSAFAISVLTFVLISLYSFRVYPMPWFSFLNSKKR